MFLQTPTLHSVLVCLKMLIGTCFLCGQEEVTSTWFNDLLRFKIIYYERGNCLFDFKKNYLPFVDKINGTNKMFTENVPMVVML